MAVTSKIHKMIGDLNDKGSKRVLLIAWGKNQPTLDLRKFEDGTPFKGISLNIEEARELKAIMTRMDIDDVFGIETREVDRKPINLYEELQDAGTIHKYRKDGYVTVDGRIKLNFKKPIDK